MRLVPAAEMHVKWFIPKVIMNRWRMFGPWGKPFGNQSFQI